MKPPQESSVPEKSEQAPGLVFPCQIDVKIFISNHAEDEAVIKRFVAGQLDREHLLDWRSRESSGGKYLAITASVDAQNREHIDTLYRCLKEHESVIMLL